MQGALKPYSNGTNGHAAGINHDTPSAELELDTLIIGGGFAGVYLLHRLRQSGYKVKIIEAGSGLGGVWHWNNYPGARVDSQWPVYQLNIPEVYSTFDWQQQYAGAPELQRYFQHADEVLDISKDTIYNTRVDKTVWDDVTQKWNITCNSGFKVKASYLHCCLGFAAKRHFPEWPGLDTFKGYMGHSSFWPKEGVDIRGKRVGCIGAGATGIQIAQESAKQAGHLTVFIRTPNTCIPMRQAPVDPEVAKEQLVEVIPRQLDGRHRTPRGFLFDHGDRSIMATPKEERDAILEAAWQRGGFAFLVAFTDVDTDITGNRYVYDFWASKTRARISDPVKRDILAPLEPLHPIFAKRASLEQDYYEQLDQDHVTVVDLRKTPIERVVPQGIVTSDGKLHELDIIAVATGYDSLTGSFAQIDIQGVNGKRLKEHWGGEQGALSHLGLAVNDFPNLFYVNGPQSPAAYANGPSVIEQQCEWILKTMDRMVTKGYTRINAKAQAEQEWKQTINQLHSGTFQDQADSWYMGANIPGKPRQALLYAGGLPRYLDTINEKLEKNFEGFEVS